ncbi:MAG: hypothetical protein WB502_11465 [Thermoactinomyces sp.]
MKEKGDFIFNTTNSQINIANDQASLKATYINNSQEDQTEKLMVALQNLLESLENEPNGNKELVKLAASTENIIDDLKEKDLSKRRLDKFREKLNNISPALQLSSTLFAAISAVNDAIQLYSGT